MTLPDWKTFAGGTKVRIALWLHQEVGPGGVFTKAQLRSAFPNVEQVDRRMRDLRPEGWVIHTNIQDVSLEPEELRLVKVGGRVWEKSYRSAGSSVISEAERRAVMLRDNFTCVYCGISAGEAYFDESTRTAVLGVTGIKNQKGKGGLVTSCGRCRDSGGSLLVEDVHHQVRKLTSQETETFLLWADKGRRSKSALDVAWSSYLRLTSEQREDLLRSMGNTETSSSTAGG